MMGISTEIPGYFLSGSGFLRVDRRVKPRSQVFKFGVIQCGSDRRILCVVKNISLTGAMIDVKNTLEIPDDFTLLLTAILSLGRVEWRGKSPSKLA
jgi:hypothetical protein